MLFGMDIKKETKMIVDSVVSQHFEDGSLYPNFDVTFPITIFYLHSDVRNCNLKYVVKYWRGIGSPN